MSSAATVNVSVATGEAVLITGTTTITSLGTGFAGCYRELRFSGALTLTHSANLLLPGASNITTAANDVYCFRCLSAGVWIMVGGSRASATLASPAFTGTATYNGVEIGFRGVPLTTRNSAYTFVAGDAGKGVAKTNTTAYTYTVNNGVHAAGDVITVVHTGSAGNVTLAEGAGFTLYLAGGTTTGNRTLAPGALAAIFFTSASTGVVSGAGVT